MVPLDGGSDMDPETPPEWVWDRTTGVCTVTDSPYVRREVRFLFVHTLVNFLLGHKD